MDEIGEVGEIRPFLSRRLYLQNRPPPNGIHMSRQGGNCPVNLVHGVLSGIVFQFPLIRLEGGVRKNPVIGIAFEKVEGKQPLIRQT